MLQNRNSAGMLAGQASLRGLTPLIGITAAATAALLYWIVGEPVFAAGFAAAIIAIAALAFYFKKLFPPTSVEEGALPDWTIARAAADGSNVAIAVTDRAGRLVCASDLFGSWFEGHPTPPDLTLDGNGGERLATAGRAAWRDGVGKVHGLRKGALMVDVEITRTGQSEDYLLWRFMPVKQANIIDDYTRLLVGEAGRQFTDAGIMGVLIGAEGRIRAANPAFLLRATGRHDAVITGRDFASFMRVDNKGCVFFAREERSAIPLRLLQIPVRPARPDGPMLLFMLDEQAGGGHGGTALSCIETLLSLLHFRVTTAAREGRFRSIKSPFARAAG